MVIRNLVFAAVSSVAMLGSGMAFAASNANSPPEPYTAPDPVYTPHAIKSDVTLHQPKDVVTLTSNGSSHEKK